MTGPDGGPGIYGPGYIGGGDLTSSPGMHSTYTDMNSARLGDPGALSGMIKSRVAELNRGGAGDPWREGMQNLFQQLVMMGYSPAHASRLIEESAGVKGLGMGRESGVIPFAGSADPFGTAINKPEIRSTSPDMMQAMMSWLGGLDNLGGAEKAQYQARGF